MAEAGFKRVSGRVYLWIIIAGVCMVLLMATSLDLKSLHAHASSLNGGLVFGMMAVLPLVGLPASVLYAVAGAKFGHGWGLLLVAAAIVFHLIGSWWVGHSWLREPIDKLFHKLRYHKPQVPEGEYVPFCLLVALVPGAPYTLKNYLLVLGGVPFRSFFWACWPAHFVSATIGVLFGDFAGSFTPAKITFLIVYALVLAGLSRYVVRRLIARKHFRVNLKDQADEADTASPELR